MAGRPPPLRQTRRTRRAATSSAASRCQHVRQRADAGQLRTSSPRSTDRVRARTRSATVSRCGAWDRRGPLVSVAEDDGRSDDAVITSGCATAVRLQATRWALVRCQDEARTTTPSSSARTSRADGSGTPTRRPSRRSASDEDLAGRPQAHAHRGRGRALPRRRRVRRAAPLRALPQERRRAVERAGSARARTWCVKCGRARRGLRGAPGDAGCRQVAPGLVVRGAHAGGRCASRQLRMTLRAARRGRDSSPRRCCDGRARPARRAVAGGHAAHARDRAPPREGRDAAATSRRQILGGDCSC